MTVTAMTEWGMAELLGSQGCVSFHLWSLSGVSFPRERLHVSIVKRPSLQGYANHQLAARCFFQRLL